MKVGIILGLDSMILKKICKKAKIILKKHIKKNNNNKIKQARKG